MLKKKSTSVITLSLLVAIAVTPQSVEASFLTSDNQLNSEQIAQADNSSENNASNHETKSKFPWWLLILVAIVPFVGWFFFGRNTQVNQESVMTENLAGSFDSTSTNNNNYEEFVPEVETQNNFNSPIPTNASFEDNTIIATSVEPVSNFTNELQKNNSFTQEINQTNIVNEVEPLPVRETDLTFTINQEPINLFEQVNQNSQSFTSDVENNLIDEVEPLPARETDLTPIIEPIIDKNELVNESNIIEANNELVEDQIGGITEWLEQLDLTFPLSDPQDNNPDLFENIAEQDDNLDLLIELDEAENEQDLESFEQLLFGDVDTNKESNNKV
ncbi:hypothetical protein Sta7437_1156 [Stanieria cyanosphaera PCC 7437]|uniref:Uncharacterized protein n=1 Tax=Stanieria cyanosphaera (strain ATCC 29371 / PCC 7437) TaxID=111780 RepID=K9XSS4_STAC7|nr:PLD nuclease N-terminal domain-containing protein [Stanieria cyanosphaera]AFZ34727.1 hypothetical protein Sta7437_1156 [Stanieria cyanosphaera PCC 7437]